MMWGTRLVVESASAENLSRQTPVNMNATGTQPLPSCRKHTVVCQLEDLKQRNYCGCGMPACGLVRGFEAPDDALFG
jgi:hypothetical protein